MNGNVVKGTDSTPQRCTFTFEAARPGMVVTHGWLGTICHGTGGHYNVYWHHELKGMILEYDSQLSRSIREVPITSGNKNNAIPAEWWQHGEIDIMEKRYYEGVSRSDVLAHNTALEHYQRASKNEHTRMDVDSMSLENPTERNVATLEVEGADGRMAEEDLDGGRGPGWRKTWMPNRGIQQSGSNTLPFRSKQPLHDFANVGDAQLQPGLSVASELSARWAADLFAQSERALGTVDSPMLDAMNRLDLDLAKAPAPIRPTCAHRVAAQRSLFEQINPTPSNASQVKHRLAELRTSKGFMQLAQHDSLTQLPNPAPPGRRYMVPGDESTISDRVLFSNPESSKTREQRSKSR
ncbi:hypothetical protein MMC11_000173 [Xylographa trunciseda]|nr:hypothetical protein [Xylographa trunciseda]